MARKLMNLCLEVGDQKVTVKLFPNDESALSPAPDTPYYFQVYHSQNDEPATSQGDSVELLEGRFQIVVWDGDPGSTPDPGLFEEPLWQDSRLLSSITGGTFSLGSGSINDPWPPT